MHPWHKGEYLKLPLCRPFRHVDFGKGAVYSPFIVTKADRTCVT